MMKRFAICEFSLKGVSVAWRWILMTRHETGSWCNFGGHAHICTKLYMFDKKTHPEHIYMQIFIQCHSATYWKQEVSPLWQKSFDVHGIFTAWSTLHVLVHNILRAGFLQRHVGDIGRDVSLVSYWSKTCDNSEPRVPARPTLQYEFTHTSQNFTNNIQIDSRGKIILQSVSHGFIGQR